MLKNNHNLAILFYIFVSYYLWHLGIVNAKSSEIIDLAGFSSEIVAAKKLSQTDICKNGQINYSDYHWNRVLSDFYVFCRAFYIGGGKAKFRFHSFPNQARLLVESKRNSNLVPMLSIELSAIDREIFLFHRLYLIKWTCLLEFMGRRVMLS